MVGRAEVLGQVTKLLQAGSDEKQNFITVTGMGGAGKTHILSELATQHEHYVFFIKAKDEDAYERALLNIATSIGQELLVSKKVPRSDLAAQWASLDASGRIDAFSDWLQTSENQRSLFVFDDIDGFKPEEALLLAIPEGPGNLLCSSRDPNILRNLGRLGEAVSLSPMAPNETVQLMENILAMDTSLPLEQRPSCEELSAISGAIYGHPLAACRAVIYICDKISPTAIDSPAKEFLNILRGSEWKWRRNFLDFRPRFGRSIMDTFEASLDRIEPSKKVYAEWVLTFAAFISPNAIDGAFVDFRPFFQHDRPWLTELKEDLPDFELFLESKIVLMEGLSELKRTSLWCWSPTSSSSLGSQPIHPLWLECIRHRVGPAGRLSSLRQICLLCEVSIARHERVELFERFKTNALNVAAKFGVQPAKLSLSERAEKWLSAKKWLSAG